MKALAGKGPLGVAEPAGQRLYVAKLRVNGSRQEDRGRAFSRHYGNFATRAGARRGAAGTFQPRRAASATHPCGVVADADLLDFELRVADARHGAGRLGPPRPAHSD